MKKNIKTRYLLCSSLGRRPNHLNIMLWLLYTWYLLCMFNRKRRLQGINWTKKKPCFICFARQYCATRIIFLVSLCLIRVHHDVIKVQYDNSGQYLPRTAVLFLENMVSFEPTTSEWGERKDRGHSFKQIIKIHALMGTDVVIQTKRLVIMCNYFSIFC